MRTKNKPSQTASERNHVSRLAEQPCVVCGDTGPVELDTEIVALWPTRIIFEDSRLQSHTWTKASSRAAAAKMARSVGQVDAWCSLIVAICAKHGIPAHGISPLGKGGKLNAEAFEKATGWTASSNEHNRDAAMVAWPYRRAAK